MKVYSLNISDGCQRVLCFSFCLMVLFSCLSTGEGQVCE